VPGCTAPEPVRRTRDEARSRGCGTRRGGVQGPLQAVTPSSAAKIGLEYRSRWWETDHRIYGGITETDLDVTHIWHPSYGFHGERGVVIGCYNTGSHADSYAPLSPGEREARAVAAGVNIYGEKHRSEPALSFSHHWRQFPYQEAAWHSTPGGPDAPATRTHRSAPGFSPVVRRFSEVL
jgi:monoamine oxidase